MGVTYRTSTTSPWVEHDSPGIMTLNDRGESENSQIKKVPVPFYVSMMALTLAAKLKKDGIKVRFIGLLDPVDCGLIENTKDACLDFDYSERTFIGYSSTAHTRTFFYNPAFLWQLLSSSMASLKTKTYSWTSYDVAHEDFASKPEIICDLKAEAKKCKKAPPLKYSK